MTLRGNKSPERILRIDLTSPIAPVIAFSIRKGETVEKVPGVFNIKYRNESENSIVRCSTEGELLLGSMRVFCVHSSTPPPTMEPNKGRQPAGHLDMRQARHLPQRWYWSIVVQVRDVIRQFTQGTNCNTNPKATVFGIPKEPVLESK
ncbi:hypothetical protein TNCV_1539371 [Trichonephila clavipes]|nr:hypothetical protein TNCV_1539371 [Trichonephila clavipes]